MKWMVILLTLTCTLQSRAQSNADQAQAALTQIGINNKNHVVNIFQETPLGTFVAIQKIREIEMVSNDRTYHVYITENFETYLKAGDSIISIAALEGFRVYGYSFSKQAFIVGKYDANSITDPQIEEVYKYDLRSQQLIIQGTYSGGIYGAHVFNDSMSLLLNVKNAGDVGINLIYVPFPIK